MIQSVSWDHLNITVDIGHLFLPATEKMKVDDNVFACVTLCVCICVSVCFQNVSENIGQILLKLPDASKIERRRYLPEN